MCGWYKILRSERETGESISKSDRVRYIHFRKNKLEKDMNLYFLPPVMG